MLMTPLPPTPPPSAVMILFLIVTFCAVICRPPVIFSQLITVPGVLIVIGVVLLLPTFCNPFGHCDISRPVFAGPGQPQDSRFVQTLLVQSTPAGGFVPPGFVLEEPWDDRFKTAESKLEQAVRPKVRTASIKNFI